MPTDAARITALTQVVTAAQALEPAAQAMAIEGAFPPADQKTADKVWVIAVAGLMSAVLIGLGGLIYLLAEGKPTSVALTAFTALLAGLLGLLSPSPIKKKA